MDVPITFVLRVTVGADGRLSGVVERVRTREKERFEGVEALGSLVTRMAGGSPVERQGETPEEGCRA